MDGAQNLRSLTRQFERIGARLTVEVSPRVSTYELDVAQSGRGRGSRDENFLLRVGRDALPSLDLQVLEARPEKRHLLLLARGAEDVGAEASLPVIEVPRGRFLCGHDERHWFVAAVPDGASRVREAMELLKPQGVARLQHRAGVRAKDWNRRKNTGFVRQGEWFFLPVDPQRGFWGFRPDPLLVLKNEPIRRSNQGKPHLVEFLYREGGEAVYVCPQRPQGVTVRQYEKLLASNPAARSWRWVAQRRNMRVFARGKVRHADHATITLDGWHQVLMNGESLSANVAFLD